MLPNGITVLAGHYGSGKTQIATHLALELRKRHAKVTLCDLDIVNPYFRTADSKDLFEAAGIRLISSPYAGSNVELPGFPPEAASVFDDPEVFSVIDVGGDDRGALALGRYADRLRDGGAAILLVINRYRPLSGSARDAADICREIEEAGRFRFTGIVNNSNLGAETTPRDVLAAIPYAEEISQKLSLPIVAVSAAKTLTLPETGYPVWKMELYRKWVSL
ncbi:MAG: hypothetical protein LBR72_07085 [Oscillospiraceae bacterium]|jgi:septum formation inhibitor-activating ATPase MinD|nr:hypothetical protein [Oscillospiraceae bacterium]